MGRESVPCASVDPCAPMYLGVGVCVFEFCVPLLGVLVGVASGRAAEAT